jgi:hypothetical protein
MAGADSRALLLNAGRRSSVRFSVAGNGDLLGTSAASPPASFRATAGAGGELPWDGPQQQARDRERGGGGGTSVASGSRPGSQSERHRPASPSRVARTMMVRHRGSEHTIT